MTDLNYEMHIGKVFNMETQREETKFKILITEDQFSLIKQLADTELDSDLIPTYIINKCRFTIRPHFEPKKD